MSKFLPERKKLLEDVFEKASSETTEKSFSGILKSLERSLSDDFNINMSYKTFETYYNSIVLNEGDYNIKTRALDELSIYLGYNSFKEYCTEWKTIEYSIQQTISKLAITIINKPILAIPDIVKKNGLGILEMTFVLLMVTGGVVFSNNKKPIGILSGWGKPAVDKNYMYWDKDRYMATDSSYLGPQVEVMPMNPTMFLYFKKITRPDTLTFENSMGRVWYDKSNNKVDFFTSFGKHPENGKTLKDISERILINYAGQQSDSIEVDE